MILLLASFALADYDTCRVNHWADTSGIPFAYETAKDTVARVYTAQIVRDLRGNEKTIEVYAPGYDSVIPMRIGKDYAGKHMYMVGAVLDDRRLVQFSRDDGLTVTIDRKLRIVDADDGVHKLACPQAQALAIEALKIAARRETIPW